MTKKQFSQSTIANREKETFSSQPETNPKSETSSNSAPDTFKKVNAIINFRLKKENDNHVGDNLNEKSNTPPTTVDDSGNSTRINLLLQRLYLLLRLLLPLPCRFRNL